MCPSLIFPRLTCREQKDPPNKKSDASYTVKGLAFVPPFLLPFRPNGDPRRKKPPDRSGTKFFCPTHFSNIKREAFQLTYRSCFACKIPSDILTEGEGKKRAISRMTRSVSIPPWCTIHFRRSVAPPLPPSSLVVGGGCVRSPPFPFPSALPTTDRYRTPVRGKPSAEEDVGG